MVPHAPEWLHEMSRDIPVGLYDAMALLRCTATVCTASGAVVVSATPDVDHLHQKRRGGVDGAEASWVTNFGVDHEDIVTEHTSLLLIPEEAMYLAFVLGPGCLEIRRDAHDGAVVASAEELLAFYRQPREDMVRLCLAYAHFLREGYVVKRGLSFGVHLLLYRGSPEDVHSDYGVWVMGLTSSFGRWHNVKVLTRLMQDVSKKLVLSSIEQEDGRPYDVATSTGGCVLREMVMDTGGWNEDADGSGGG
mmetsp:Transcript_9408/g.22307  ORF Transcript_9408/g.22307 Transcript_9408/m.22307 type:complete len:249 (-) Transcript_9408:169-915(-)